ncbi:MAG: UDP-N-acetylbacillosamine N-acetyltransferase [Paraglaciecola sp.]
MTKQLIILGASGHGKVAADCAEATGEYDSIAFLDALYPDECSLGEWPILEKPENAHMFCNENTFFFVAIGNNFIRKELLSGLLQHNFNVISLIHPRSVVSPYAKISHGVLVCANATINPMAKVGIGVIVNTAASIDHDCVIGDFAHVSVGVRLAGAVVVGSNSFVGINSCAIQGVTIGKNCILGAGATLISDLPDNTTAVGTPAKVIKTREI